MSCRIFRAPGALTDDFQRRSSVRACGPALCFCAYLLLCRFTGRSSRRGAQGGGSHQVMRQRVPQHHSQHFRPAADAHAVETVVAGLGVHALDRRGTFACKSPSLPRGHALPPLGHGRAVVGTRRMQVAASVFEVCTGAYTVVLPRGALTWLMSSSWRSRHRPVSPWAPGRTAGRAARPSAPFFPGRHRNWSRPRR